MEEPKCKECIHFHQHYVRLGEGYQKAGCGHCVHCQLKHRKPNTSACLHYVKKSAPAEEITEN